MHELGAALSKDGRTLVCYDWIDQPGPQGHCFRFYDIPNRRAWLWALGVPAVLAALVGTWRRGRSFLSRKHHATRLNEINASSGTS